jgi:hypothetical protein
LSFMKRLRVKSLSGQIFPMFRKELRRIAGHFLNHCKPGVNQKEEKNEVQ